jgi:heme/copper-type cytochrome/quinol oxidase subunit 3
VPPVAQPIAISPAPIPRSDEPWTGAGFWVAAEAVFLGAAVCAFVGLGSGQSGSVLDAGRYWHPALGLSGTLFLVTGCFAMGRARTEAEKGDLVGRRRLLESALVCAVSFLAMLCAELHRLASSGLLTATRFDGVSRACTSMVVVTGVVLGAHGVLVALETLRLRRRRGTDACFRRAEALWQAAALVWVVLGAVLYLGG